MPIYKNTGISAKVFYRVKYPVGSIHEVPGFINDPNFIRIDQLPLEETVETIPEVITEKAPSKRRGRKPKNPEPETEASNEVVEDTTEPVPETNDQEETLDGTDKD